MNEKDIKVIIELARAWPSASPEQIIDVQTNPDNWQHGYYYKLEPTSATSTLTWESSVHSSPLAWSPPVPGTYRVINVMLGLPDGSITFIDSGTIIVDDKMNMSVATDKPQTTKIVSE